MPPAVLSRRLRWLAPAVAAGVVAAGVVVPRLADASASVDDLEPRTAAELLAAVSTAEVDGLSGTVVATSRLGLPELPQADSGSAVSLTDLLAGSTTARVWKAGDHRTRIAVDAPFAEYDVVRDGREVWTYDSASKDVTHLTLPEGEDEPAAEPSRTATPQEAAEAVLQMLTPSTEATVGRAAEVAGRPAYELVLDPRDAGTLVDTVRIAVDGETDVPLRVQVFGVEQAEPAVEVGFTDVRFAAPDASVFAFVPPAGSEVTERTLPQHRGDDADRSAAPEHQTRQGSAPEVLGEGWTSVVRLRGVTLPEQAAGLVGQLSRPVEGGRVVESALLSVLLTDDGRVLAGAVPAQRLVELAGR
ncbi:MAG: DUF2092 domain-containing protein [Actinomycetota bacterium]|nr:DUF2092 domain-containing protein [Actinomycetota bacterium]